MLSPQEYLSAGWHVAPIKKGEAYPPFKNWHSRTFTASDFEDEHGVALLCGKPDAAPIVDVDLDIPEAAMLASVCLPKTGCIFGRASSSKSHYLYRSKGPTKKWKQNKVGMIVELRSTKSITILPPTEHKSGETREWHECSPKLIQTVKYESLVDDLNTLASCALIARLWPSAGMRHEFALGVGGWLAKELELSVDKIELIIRRMMHYSSDNEPEDRIRAVIESAKSHYGGKKVSAFNIIEPIIGKSNAIALRNWSKHPTLPGNGKPKPDTTDDDPIRGTSEGVVDALGRINVEVRCNVRTMNSEFRILDKELKEKLGKPKDSEWIEDSDDLQAVLRVTTESRLVFANGKKTIHAFFPKQKWEDGLMFARSPNMVDPFKAWLESCPKWDGKSRLFEIVTTIWELRYKDEVEYSQWAFASRILAAIDRTYNPGAKVDEMIILQSDEEGTGKSTSIGLMFPKDSRRQRKRSAWLHEGLRLDTFDPRQPLESIGQAVFVEASEMQGRRKVDVDRLKGWLSQRYDQHRFAWGRVARHLPRRFVVFGTSNEVDCLPSDMGDGRRYLPIALARKMSYKEAEGWFDINREQIWAEALHFFNEGETHYLPYSGEIREQHGAAVTRHRGGVVAAEYSADKVIAAVSSPTKRLVFDHHIGGKVTKCVTANDIMETARAIGLNNSDMHNVTKGLRIAGWKSRTIRREGKVVRVWAKE